MCGFPQTLRERIQCAWFHLRYPGRVGIVYAPTNYEELRNGIVENRRNVELSTRKARQLKNALSGDGPTVKEARRLAKELS